MYLKQIELENFKSFGGKLTIPLMEGYLAVTGPNGSGKSNITDAILFVLGPKSSKAIRAGKLTDLIFDGGQSKNKAEFTKVSLVFNNADRMLPWDADEVKLTRHVKFASNKEDYTSTFYINDQRSTMSEFDSLLVRARISAEGYNMVQQGDVTRIVQMGNIDRRRVLDGISGISSYDADINKAQNEKAEAETNLTLINVVVEELEKQIQQLQKDMEAAKKYLEAQGRMEMAKAQQVYRNLDSEKLKLDATNEMISNLETEIGDLVIRKDKLALKIEELERARKDKESEIEAKVGPEYRELKEKIELAKIKTGTLRDRIERATDDKHGQEIEVATYSETLREINTDLEGCINSIAENEMTLTLKQSALGASKEETARIGEEMSSKGGEHTELQSKLDKLEMQIDEKSTVEHEANVQASSSDNAEKDASYSLASLEEQIKTADFDIKDSEWNLSKVKEEAGPITDVSTFTNKILAMKREESEFEKQEQDIISAVNRISQDYNALLAEKKVTERMSKGSEAVTAILEMRDKGQIKGIRGTIAELASVDPEYEVALSIAAGGKMQAIVVDDDQVASDVMSIIKKNNIGRATFLPLNKMMEGKPRAKAIMIAKQTSGYAIDLISFKEEYHAAFWYVFGDTLVVENLSEGRRLMGGVRIVTKDGELMEASGAMVGGTVGRQSGVKFGAASQSRLDDVSAELRSANDSLELLREKLRALRDDIRAADNQMRAAGAGNMEFQGKIGKIEGQLKSLRESRKQLQSELVIRRGALERATKDNADSKARLSVALAELESLKSERTKIRNRIAEIAPVEMQQRMQKARDAVYNLTNEVSDLINSRSSLTAERSGYENSKTSVESDIAKMKNKIAEDISIIQKSNEDLLKAQVEIDALRIIESQMESGIADLRDEKDRILGDKLKAENDRNNTIDKTEAKRGLRIQQDAIVEITNNNISQLQADIEKIKIQVERPIPSDDELKRTIRSCETVMAKIGNVNLRAIEDYDEKKTRYDLLTGNVTKLNMQIEELTDLMTVLNGKKKGLFMTVYDGVNTNFKEIYSELSGGGEAFMNLENEDDPFTGGLLINAKPRNGKLLRLDALSGGEKSLTALAFIFAIQELQPSPFYVLDEVDMFLDSINAELVAKRVKKSSEKAQFVQVSLRKVTLSLADHLIGVTRQPNGISKVVIQPDLSEVSKYEEEAVKKRKEAEKGQNSIKGYDNNS